MVVSGRMVQLTAVRTQTTIIRQNTIVQRFPADGIVHLIRDMLMQGEHLELGFVLRGPSK